MKGPLTGLVILLTRVLIQISPSSCFFGQLLVMVCNGCFLVMISYLKNAEQIFHTSFMKLHHLSLCCTLQAVLYIYMNDFASNC